MVASHTTPTGDLAQNPDMCPDWESNQQPFGSQAHTQSTEPHQPGPERFNFKGQVKMMEKVSLGCMVLVRVGGLYDIVGGGISTAKG